MSTIVMSALVWGMSAGAAEDGSCRFTDVVTGESRDCLKGPSTNSLPYLYRVDESAWRIAEKFEGKFVRVMTKFDGTWVDEDPAYDESTADQEERDRAFDAWVNLVKILVLIVNGADAYITSLGLTGQYDGIVCNDQ